MVNFGPHSRLRYPQIATPLPLLSSPSPPLPLSPNLAKRKKLFNLFATFPPTHSIVLQSSNPSTTQVETYYY